MRLVPQRRLSTAICLISVIVSSDIRGLRALPFDFRRQKSLKPSLGQRNNDLAQQFIQQHDRILFGGR